MQFRVLALAAAFAAAAVAAGPARLVAVRPAGDAEASIVELVGDKPLSFTTMRLASPPRVVVDVADADPADVPRAQVVDDGTVKRVGVLPVGNGTARVVIELAGETEFDVRTVGPVVQVRVARIAPLLAKAEPPTVPEPPAAPSPQKPPPAPEPQAQPSATAEPPPAQTAVAASEAALPGAPSPAPASQAAPVPAPPPERRVAEGPAVAERRPASPPERPAAPPPAATSGRSAAASAAKPERALAASAPVIIAAAPPRVVPPPPAPSTPAAPRAQAAPPAQAVPPPQASPPPPAATAQRQPKEQNAAVEVHATEPITKPPNVARPSPPAVAQATPPATAPESQSVAAAPAPQSVATAPTRPPAAPPPVARPPPPAAKPPSDRRVASSSDASREEVERARAKLPTVSIVASPPPAAAPAARPAAAPAKPRARTLTAITGIGFRPTAGGIVMVRSDRPLDYAVTGEGKVVVVHLRGAGIPLTTNRLPLDTRFFDTSVVRVIPQPVAGGVELRIELRGQARYELQQASGLLTIAFQRS